MEFRQLEAFVYVAETKSFSKAAKYLYLSQSTVSSHIKNLEKELQKKLISRSTKTVKLTKEGISFLFYAQRLLSTRDVALQTLNEPDDSFIHIGASTIPSGYLLPELLSAFRKEHPDVFFDIKQGDSAAIQNRISDATVELGLVGNKDDSGKFEYIPFCTDEIVIIAPASKYFIELKQNKVSVEELLKEPIIIREYGSGTQKSAMLFLEKMGISTRSLNVVAQNNDLESIKRMVTNGIGISISSKIAVKNLEETGQVIVFPVESDIKRSFYISYLKNKDIKPILKEFINFTREFFSNNNP